MGNVIRRPAAFLITLINAALLAPVAQALPFEINEDVTGVWNSVVVAAAAVRVKNPDKQLVGYNNANQYPGAKGAVSTLDDGNLNYQKGDLVSAPLQYTTDLELRYQRRYGVHGNARSWPASAGEDTGLHHGNAANRHQPNAKLDDSDYQEYNQFSGYEVLDMYAYGNWDIGDTLLTVRFGQQSINWGESLLYVGINGFNPLNFSALGRAGVRQDEALVSVNRLYGNLITRNGISIEAFYALDWESSHFPPCGSLLGIDSILDPGCLQATAATGIPDQQQLSQPALNSVFVIPLTDSDKPRSSGQFGVSTRYFVEELDTEFGLYFANFHSTTPVIGKQLCTTKTVIGTVEACTGLGGLRLPLQYQENVQAFAISAASGVQNLSLSAELSYFHDLPVQRNLPELSWGAINGKGIYAERMEAAGPGATFDGSIQVDRTQLLLGGVMDLTSHTGLADATLVGEVAGQWVDLPSTNVERIGRNGNWGAAASALDGCDSRTQYAGGCATDGFATEFNWSYRLLATFSLPRPGCGLEFRPQFGWNHDDSGYSVEGFQVEGRQIFGASVRTIFQRAFFLDVGRTWVRSNTDYDPARDKDAYFIATGMAF
mgnify:FL=1